MKKCAIQINRDGSITVRDNKRLFNELIAYTDGDVQQAITLYGVSLTEDFKSLGIESPKMEHILSYVTQDHIDNAGQMTQQDELNLLQLRVSDSTESDIRESFIEAFTEDGIFSINMDKIRESGIFDEIDIYAIAENIEQLTNLYYKLQNSEYIAEPMSYDFVEGQLFDKINPDLTETTLLENYIGLTTADEVLTRAAELEDETVLQTKNGVQKVLELIKGKEAQVAYEYNPLTDTIEKRTISSKNELVQTLDNSEDYSELITAAESISDMLQTQPFDANFFERYLPVLQEYSARLNLDFSTITNKFHEGNTEELVEFFDSLYNFLIDIQEGDVESLTESLEYFTNSYDNLLGETTTDVSKEIKPARETSEMNDFHLETNLTEGEIFTRHSAIKVGDNTYRKVGALELGELYTMILNYPALLKEKVFTIALTPENTDLLIQELDRYVLSQTHNLVDNTSDLDDLKRIVAHKILEQADTEEYSKPPSGIYSMNLGEFLVNFKANMLENSVLKDIFYFSANGLQAKLKIGNYTKNQLKIILKDSWKDLVNYAKITGNTSLRELATENLNTIEQPADREYYSNNINRLPNYRGNYIQHEDHYMIDSQNDFLRIGDKLLEKVTDGVYGEVIDGQQPNITTEAGMEKLKKIQSEIKIEKASTIKDDTIEFC